MRRFRNKEVASIINLPVEDFDFFKCGDKGIFRLYIHHKHFEDWTCLPEKEVCLLNLGLFIKSKIKDKYFYMWNSNYIEIFIRSEDVAITIGKYYYDSYRLKSDKSVVFFDWRYALL